MTYSIRIGRVNAYHPALYYIIFHGIVFVLRPFFVYVLNVNFVFNVLELHMTDDLWLKTLAATSLGLIVFTYVCIKASGRATMRFSVVTITAEHRTALLFTTLLLLPYILYSLRYIFLMGATEIGQRIDGVYIMVGTSGYLLEGYCCLGGLSLIFLYLYRFSWWSAVPLVIFTVIRVYFGWGRAAFVFNAVAAMMMFLYWKRRYFLAARPVLASILLLLVFIEIGKSRTALSEWLAGGSQPVVHESLTLAERLPVLDFSNFDFLAFVIRVVPDLTRSYTYGTQYLQIFTEPIPRMLWEGKPIGLPISFFNLNDYGDFGAYTTSLVGDGWMSGGWAGVVVTMGIFGYMFGRLYASFKARSDEPFFFFSYIPIIAFSPQFFRDGGISVLKFLLFWLLPILIWWAFWRFGRLTHKPMPVSNVSRRVLKKIEMGHNARRIPPGCSS